MGWKPGRQVQSAIHWLVINGTLIVLVSVNTFISIQKSTTCHSIGGGHLIKQVYILF